MCLSHSPSSSSLQHSSHLPLHDDLGIVRVVPPRHEDCWVTPESAAAHESVVPRAATGQELELMVSCAPRAVAVERAEVAARTEIATTNLHVARIEISFAVFKTDTSYSLKK